MEARILKFGRYFINLNNVAYVETVKTTRGNAIVDIVFISGETKVRFTDQDAIQVLNFFEMTYEKVAT
jgi:hypothetical protein